MVQLLRQLPRQPQRLPAPRLVFKHTIICAGLRQRQSLEFAAPRELAQSHRGRARAQSYANPMLWYGSRHRMLLSALHQPLEQLRPLLRLPLLGRLSPSKQHPLLEVRPPSKLLPYNVVTGDLRMGLVGTATDKRVVFTALTGPPVSAFFGR